MPRAGFLFALQNRRILLTLSTIIYGDQNAYVHGMYYFSEIITGVVVFTLFFKPFASIILILFDTVISPLLSPSVSDLELFKTRQKGQLKLPVYQWKTAAN